MIGYGRYSHHALRALRHARAFAEEYHHPEVDTAHLLMGILQEEGSVGWRVLHELDVISRRGEIILQTLYPTTEQARDAPELSGALRCALEIAIDEARWLEHHYIGTEHQLLGIVRGGSGQAPAFLRAYNVTADQVRRKVRRLVQSGMIEISLDSARSMARLSELSKRALNAAEQLAKRSHHEHVSLTHLLMVISQERRSACRGILEESGFRADELEAAIQRPNPLTGGPLDVILNNAVKEADRIGSSYTGTDHMLLAISLYPRGKRILQMCGADPVVVEQRVREIIGR